MTGWIQQRINQLTVDMMANPHFLNAVETVINTKGYVERKIQAVLHTMTVASKLDVDLLSKKVEDGERRIRQMAKRFESLQAEIEALRSKLQQATAASAVASAPPPASKPQAEPVVVAGTPAPVPVAVPSEADAAPIETLTEQVADASSVVDAPAAIAEPPKQPAPQGAMEGACARCGTTFQKKTFNQRFCSSACRSGV